MQHLDRAVAFVVVVGCAAAASAGCSAPSPNMVKDTAAIVAPYPPPAILAEIPPPAPAPNSLWLVGHWNWEGGRYLWTSGRYIHRPAPAANWVPGYWEQESQGWVWTDGHWAS
jgi:WXXGXW repeat (2 copies)